jgi:hypothetical protein
MLPVLAHVASALLQVRLDTTVVGSGDMILTGHLVFLFFSTEEHSYVKRIVFIKIQN